MKNTLLVICIAFSTCMSASMIKDTIFLKNGSIIIVDKLSVDSRGGIWYLQGLECKYVSKGSLLHYTKYHKVEDIDIYPIKTLKK